MDFNVNVRFEGLTTIERKLDALTAAAARILAKETDMAGELDALKAQVSQNTTVIGSAIALIQGLKAKLDAAGTDPAALAALSAELGAQDQALADAITANTPAA